MLKLNNIERLQIIERIMPLCLALFFCRTVFIGYKYLFFLTLVPCVVYSAYWFLKNGIAKLKWHKLLLPLMVIALFFAHFSPISNVVKESVNALLVLYFLFFTKVFHCGQLHKLFFKWLIYLVIAAGVIAILRFGLSLFGVSLPYGSLFFEGGGFALVSDYNFYSLFFIIVIILSPVLLRWHDVHIILVFIGVLVSIINIGANLSIRAYTLYAILFLVLTIITICYPSKEYKLSYAFNVFILVIVGVSAIIIAVTNTIYYPQMSYNDKYKYYTKLNSIFDNSISYLEFDVKQQRKYWSKEIVFDSTNLFCNGDLKYGIGSWDVIREPNDCVSLGLLKNDGDAPSIIIKRDCSSGFWQVHYNGRPIVYYKDVTYKISFAYRILEGPTNPFMVGWWLNEGKGYVNNLPQNIVSIDSVWNNCSVSYKFNADQMNPICFLNSLQAGSIIEVKDIQMTCDDTLNRPRYVDQLSDSILSKYYHPGNVSHFTSPRTDRWRYALELWQTRYDTKQKIFGQGFKYLEWYGERFWKNPDRHDFPHNPIISSFLYSGIIGGVVYIIFLIMSLWLYWKKRQQLGIFFIMYLCCMFFSMFSGSSHFSFPLFAFLSFLPFVETGRKTVPVTEK